MNVTTDFATSSADGRRSGAHSREPTPSNTVRPDSTNSPTPSRSSAVSVDTSNRDRIDRAALEQRPGQSGRTAVYRHLAPPTVAAQSSSSAAATDSSTGCTGLAGLRVYPVSRPSSAAGSEGSSNCTTTGQSNRRATREPWPGRWLPGPSVTGRDGRACPARRTSRTYVGVRTLPRASITSASLRHHSVPLASQSRQRRRKPHWTDAISVEPSTDPAAYPLHHRIRVRFAETDAMQIVHHGRYLPYLEEARVAYLRHIGHPYTEWREQGTDSAVLEAYVRYSQAAPLRRRVRRPLRPRPDVTRTTFQMGVPTYVYSDVCADPEPLPTACSTWSGRPNPPAGVADRHAWTTVTSVPCCFRCYYGERRRPVDPW